MQYRQLSSQGPQVSEIGFGAWALGGGWGPQSDRDSLAALHAAIDRGVNFVDTAEGYGDGHSERLIAQVLQERRRAGPGCHQNTAGCRALAAQPLLSLARSVFGSLSAVKRP